MQPATITDSRTTTRIQPGVENWVIQNSPGPNQANPNSSDRLKFWAAATGAVAISNATPTNASGHHPKGGRLNVTSSPAKTAQIRERTR